MNKVKSFKPLRFFLLALTAFVYSLSIQSQYSVEQNTKIFDANGVSIAYTVAGEENSTPVLMVMGLMASHKLWGEKIVNDLVDAGYKVILFDNRDTGDSERLDRLGEPNLWWKYFLSTVGISFSTPYTLSDMANDGIAVLDELDIESAHLVGASMGGMIVQTMAFENPSRAKSLVSIMSTTGAKHLSGMSEEMEGDFEGVEDLDIEETHKYGFYPEAMPRQLTAIFHAGDRSDQVSKIKVRTLVQHGLDDPLLPSDHGIHTAELIEGSEIKLYEGMAHNLPDEVIPLLISDMINLFHEG